MTTTSSSRPTTTSTRPTSSKTPTAACSCVDTGGWYKLCCPTSQLPKPDVLGAIYRVRKTGAAKVDDPRGLKLDWDRPDARRPDRPARRPPPGRAAAGDPSSSASWAKAAVEAVAAVVTTRSARRPRRRRNAVWAATRIDHADARARSSASALSDPDETVRQAAVPLGEPLARPRGAVPRLARPARGTVAAQNRRAAAEALGRIGDPCGRAAPCWRRPAGRSDPVLGHSLTYALIEIDDPAGDRAPASPSPTTARTRRAAIVALDQMDGGRLTPDDVAPGLASTDPATRETASWIVGRHPEWAGVAGRVLPGAARRERPDRRRARGTGRPARPVRRVGSDPGPAGRDPATAASAPRAGSRCGRWRGRA